MFISKKKYNELVKRVEALERKSEVDSKITTYEYGTLKVENFARKIASDIANIKKELAKAKTSASSEIKD